MLYPSLAELLKYVNSRYLLVNVIAKRAREISIISEENGIPLDEKPVSIAIDEIASGQLRASTDSEF